MRNNILPLNIILIAQSQVREQWLAGLAELKARYQSMVDLRLIAIMDEFNLLASGDSITFPYEVKSTIPLEQGVANLRKKYSNLSNGAVIVIDLTKSEKLVNYYLEFIELDWHIISSNQDVLTRSIERHNYFIGQMLQKKTYFGSNAMFAGALGIQNLLRELKQIGDSIIEISGVFSGALSYLLGHYDGKVSFTGLIKQACQQGILAADPRAELAGQTVVQKLLLLARISGFRIDVSDFKATSLLPEELLGGNLEYFWSQQVAIDDYMSALYSKAKDNNEVLTYTAHLTCQQNATFAEAKLQSLKPSHVLAQYAPLDNVIVLKTECYGDNPLIIRGMGAGIKETLVAANLDLNTFVTQVANHMNYK